MTTTTATVALPEASGGWREIELAEPRAWAEHPQGFQSRIAFAAAHVVADPRGENVPVRRRHRLEATLAFRQHLFRYGLGVAEAMDTRSATWSGLACHPAVDHWSAAVAREHGAGRFWRGTDQLDGPAII
jgi:hypothetical protein